jgi:hypothetical protein
MGAGPAWSRFKGVGRQRIKVVTTLNGDSGRFKW